MERTFDVAPWPVSLWVMSVFATVVCVGSAVAVAFAVPAEPGWARAAALTAIMLLPIGAWLVRVRGYALDGRELRVLRPLGPVCVPLDGLRGVEVEPGVFDGAVRTFGNGGFYGFSGWYWSRARGRMRLWVTDPSRAVRLVFDGRSVVVSPADPEGFVREVRARVGAT